MDIKERQALFALPNLLTFLRVALVPVVGGLLIFQIYGSLTEKTRFILDIITCALFTLAAISDVVDGYLARRYLLVSKVGKFFDPLADKLMHVAVLILLIPLGRIDVWMVVVLTLREFYVTGIRSMAAGEGIVLAADQWGKNKSALLNLALIGLLFGHSLLGINFVFIATVLLYVVLLVSLGSASNYTFVILKQLVTKNGK